MRKEQNFPKIFTGIGSEQLTKIDIEYIKSISKEAGDRAVTMLNDIKVEFKKDDSLVTHIDRQTELFIRGKLEEKYPGYAFQGEEYGRIGSDGIPLWAVDPIDGTTNMVFGIPLWGVSIGLIVEGVAVAGVFYMPLTNQMFWGVRGEGSFCNGARLQTKDRTEIHPEDTVGFTSGAIKTLEFPEISGRRVWQSGRRRNSSVGGRPDRRHNEHGFRNPPLGSFNRSNRGQRSGRGRFLYAAHKPDVLGSSGRRVVLQRSEVANKGSI